VNTNDIVTAYKGAAERLLLLDYDGVLAPIVPLPEQAEPSGEVIGLLRQLSTYADCVVVSGRHRETLDEWLGGVSLGFVAEHGLWRRTAEGSWQPGMTVAVNWKPNVAAIMQSFAKLLPGALVEEKTAALAFHYRNVVDSNVDKHIAKLLAELEPLLLASRLRVLHGKKVVEVLPHGIDKGSAVAELLAAKPYDFILAAGDDVTDEALFAAMPAAAFTVKVGEGTTAAKYRVDSQPDFIRLLAAFAEIE
jgi:trehalose 6-phosphate synthase/phosphatase